MNICELKNKREERTHGLNWKATCWKYVDCKISLSFHCLCVLFQCNSRVDCQSLIRKLKLNSWNCILSACEFLKSSSEIEDVLNSGNQYYGEIEQYKLSDRFYLN